MQLSYKNLNERIIHTMAGTLATLALVYVAVLLSLIFSVIERKQNMIAIKDASSLLSQLEGEYANIVSSITETELKDSRFVRIDNATFAVRKDDIASYTVLYAR
ncbi:MAG: hypothetical protein KBC21_01305 [Candidatus Pacebacteria bacterium]|jgi:cell shape-determining protein MreC|nr:hypothetical protein [Candidatus Paceibacterota bacterium]